jgi:hypothetical protein
MQLSYANNMGQTMNTSGFADTSQSFNHSGSPFLKPSYDHFSGMQNQHIKNSRSVVYNQHSSAQATATGFLKNR